MKEKRRYIRLGSEKIKVKLRNFDKDIDFDFHGIEDLSIGGISFFSESEMKEGDYVLLTIDAFDLDVKHLIKCVATVVRVISKEHGFDIAFNFEKISHDDAQQLNYIMERTGDI